MNTYQLEGRCKSAPSRKCLANLEVVSDLRFATAIDPLAIGCQASMYSFPVVFTYILMDLLMLVAHKRLLRYHLGSLAPIAMK